jgi:hypothetical protein
MALGEWSGLQVPREGQAGALPVGRLAAAFVATLRLQLLSFFSEFVQRTTNKVVKNPEAKRLSSSPKSGVTWESLISNKIYCCYIFDQIHSFYTS